MKKLILVRHCKSSWSDPYLSDFDRPLNNRGINDGNLMSDFLSKKISDIDLLLSSSSNRTVLTSKFFIKKNMLIKKIVKPGGTLIDYACGKGGDLPKWISSKLKFVPGGRK